MKIYIILPGYAYEGYGEPLKEAFLTREEAQLHCKKFSDQLPEGRKRWQWLDEFEVEVAGTV